jgi:hypothetical protein
MKLYVIEVEESFYGSNTALIKEWAFSSRKKAEQKLADLTSSSCYYKDLKIVEIIID